MIKAGALASAYWNTTMTSSGWRHTTAIPCAASDSDQCESIWRPSTRSGSGSASSSSGFESHESQVTSRKFRVIRWPVAGGRVSSSQLIRSTHCQRGWPKLPLQSVPALPRTRYGCSGTLGHPPTTIRIGGRRFKHPVLVKDGLISVRGVVHLSLDGPSWVSGTEVLHIPTAIHRSLCTTPCRQVLQTAFSRGRPGGAQPEREKCSTSVKTTGRRPPASGLRRRSVGKLGMGNWELGTGNSAPICPRSSRCLRRDRVAD